MSDFYNTTILQIANFVCTLKIMMMELNNTRLLVNDFDACFDFYANTLGLKVDWGQPGDDYASFNIGRSMALSIFKSDLMAQAVGNSGKSLPTNHRDRFVICINVEDVDAIYEKLRNKIEFTTVPKDMTGWGNRTAHLRDPEGNLIELWSGLTKDKWDKDLLADAEKYS